MKKLLYIIFLLSAFGAKSQNAYKGLPSAVWPKLYTTTYQKDPQGEFDKPTFNKEVKALAGKIVVLPGYMVPFENGMKGTHFMLSSLPLNACFFCGVGGQESVVEVFLIQAISYTDKPVEVKGKLILNDSDPDRMTYVLENAEFLGAIDF